MKIQMKIIPKTPHLFIKNLRYLIINDFNLIVQQKIHMINNNDNIPQQLSPQPPQQQDLTLKSATLLLRKFVSERNWQKYHTPRNLVLALVGQVGQIAQIFQWKDQVPPGLPNFTPKQRTHVGQEIADVLSYLLRLADVSGIDIQAALRDKLEKNRRKYPEEKIRTNEGLFLEIKEQRRVKRQEQGKEKQLEGKVQQEQNEDKKN